MTRVVRHDGHPMRACAERHPTLRRGVPECAALAVLLAMFVRHLVA